eukprot:SAG31_NODE_2023_length_6645_cov_15.211121_3_plen_70_part_00
MLADGVFKTRRNTTTICFKGYILQLRFLPKPVVDSGMSTKTGSIVAQQRVVPALRDEHSITSCNLLTSF